MANKERPGRRTYAPGVPADVDIPDEPLHASLSQSDARSPRRVAIRFLGGPVTYRELNELANRFANALIALGVRKGDRVALLMPNCPQMLLAYYGVLRAGAVMVPTSPLYVESELEHQLADACVTVLVCLSPLFGRLQSIRATPATLRHAIVTNIKE